MEGFIIKWYAIGCAVAMALFMLFLEVERRAGRNNNPALLVILVSLASSWLGVLCYFWLLIETVFCYNGSKYDKGIKTNKKEKDNE